MKDVIKHHLKQLFEETFNIPVNKILFSKNKYSSQIFSGNVYYGDNKKLKYKFMTTPENDDSFTTKLVIPTDDDLYHSAYFSSLIENHTIYKKVRSCYNLNHKYKQFRLDEYDSPIVVKQTVKNNKAEVTHEFNLHIFSVNGLNSKSASEGQLDTNLALEWTDDGLINVRDSYLKQNIHYPNRRRILAFQGHGDNQMEPNENTYNFILDIIHQNFIHFVTVHQQGVLPIDDMTMEEVYKTNHVDLNYKFIADNLVRDMVLI